MPFIFIISKLFFEDFLIFGCFNISNFEVLFIIYSLFNFILEIIGKLIEDFLKNLIVSFFLFIFIYLLF